MTSTPSDGPSISRSEIAPTTPADAAGASDATSVLDRPRFNATDAIWLIVIIATAFALRWVCLSQWQDGPLASASSATEAYYDEWARSIVKGEPYEVNAYTQPPLYAWWLSLVYRVTSPGGFGARFVQAFLGALACGAAYLLGRTAFDRLTGILAGLGAATYWVAVFRSVELTPTTPVVLLLTAAIWLALRGAMRGGVGSWLLAGLSLGLAALAQVGVLPFAIVMLVWAIAASGGAGRRSAAVVAMLIGLVVPIAGVAARNSRVSQDLVLISTRPALLLFAGNSLDASGVDAYVPGFRLDLRGAYQDALSRAEREVGQQLGPGGVAKYYRSQAQEEISAVPADILKLLLSKIAACFDRPEVSVERSLPLMAEMGVRMLKHLPLDHGFIVPFGLVGIALVLASGRGGGLFPLWAFPLIYGATIAVYYVDSSMRLPMAFPLIVLTAHAVLCLRDAYHEKRWPRLGGALAGIVVLAGLLNFGILGGGVAKAKEYFDSGAKAYQAGKYADSVVWLRRSAALAWNGVEAHQGLAAALAVLQDYRGAALECRVSLALNPGNTTALRLLASSLLKTAEEQLRADDAEGAFRSLVEAAVTLKRTMPQLEEKDRPYAVLADILARLRRVEEAEENFELALKQQPDAAEIHLRYAGLLALIGKWPEAAKHYGETVRLAPPESSVLQDVTTVLIQAGRHAEARQILRDQLSRKPGDKAAALVLSSLLAKSPMDEIRDGAEAVRLAESACTQPADRRPHVLATLAAAYAEVGRFDDAVTSMQEAIRQLSSKTASESDPRLQHYSAQLGLFKAGKPYRFALPTTQPATMPATAASTTAPVPK